MIHYKNKKHMNVHQKPPSIKPFIGNEVKQQYINFTKNGTNINYDVVPFAVDLAGKLIMELRNEMGRPIAKKHAEFMAREIYELIIEVMDEMNHSTKSYFETMIDTSIKQCIFSLELTGSLGNKIIS